MSNQKYTVVPDKDPKSIEPYFFVWCADDGTNAAGGTGELQGATISSYTVTAQNGITKDSDNKSAVTIAGVSYAVNTVVTVWLSGGTDQSTYEIECVIVTSD